MKPSVFISYNHKDEHWKDRLVRHLEVLVSEDELTVWDDRQISAGDDWLPAIEKALADAQVAVLLITADFLRSDFIRRKEVPTLLQRRKSEGIWVVPLLVMPCPWQAVDWLSALQFRPKGARPLASGKKHQIEAHLAALALEVRDLVGITAEKVKAETESEASLPVDSLISVPKLPSHVDLKLPTKDPGVWIPREGTPWIEEEQIRSEVPELARLTDADGEVLYEMVEFEVPDEVDRARGLWDEHLDTLVREGKISLWSPGLGDGVILGLMRSGRLAAGKLRNSQLLSRATVTVSECEPLRQEPVPGSRTAAGEMRYPDLPIRSDYLDLVETREGVHLLAALKRGEMESFAQFRPEVNRDGQGRDVIKWSLRLRGRRQPLLVEIGLEAGAEPFQAHWMVWPNFRSANGAGWRTYYIYEHCSFRCLHADTLWLQPGASPEASRLRRRLADPWMLAYPVPFEVAAEVPSHRGGPPLALSLRDTRNDHEHGLYLVPLKVLACNPSPVAVAIDFGNSYSMAAVRVGDEGNGSAQTVDFVPELDYIDYRNAERALSLHLSEDRYHVEAPLKEGGLLATGLWLPTYAPASSSGLGNGFLPSKLLVVGPLSKLRLDELLPVAGFSIPAVSAGLAGLAEHVLADFKWETSTVQYRGREGRLREHYLSLFLDLVMADVVLNHTGGFPEGPVNLSFNYSLRSTEKQVKEYGESLRRVIGRCAAGFQLVLKDNVGIYDESRAARLSPACFGEVALVGDLGSGTLDLSIAA